MSYDDPMRSRVSEGHPEFPPDSTPVEVAKDIARLLQSDDPYDRVRAYDLSIALSRNVDLPDGTWTVFSTYKDGWGGPGRVALWSAHTTEEDARAWHAAWDAHWKAKRKEYETHVEPRDEVPAHYLRHPGLDPGEFVNRDFQ